jgi:hypothetical protein
MQCNTPINYQWLREKYCKEKLTTKEISELCNRDYRTIGYHLAKAGIKTRGTKAPRALYKNKEWLIEEYIKKGRSLKSIANECKTQKSAICYSMDKLGINRRHPQSRIKDGKKECSLCHTVLPLSSFWSKKSSVDGYWHYCMKCHKKRYEKYNKEYCKIPEVKERMRKISREWDKQHPDKALERVRKYEKKMRNVVWYRLANCMRRSIWYSLKGNKHGHWETLVGYTVDQLRRHIESLWESWMSWDNWGVCKLGVDTWQIDHIRPITSFKITSQKCKDFKKCWSLKNLRPLRAVDNIKKNNKYNLGVI